MSRYLKRLSRKATGRPMDSPLMPAIRVWSRTPEPLTSGDPLEITQAEVPLVEPGPAEPAQETAVTHTPLESHSAEASDTVTSPPRSPSRIRPEWNDSHPKASTSPPEDLDQPLKRPPPARHFPGTEEMIELPPRAIDRLPRSSAGETLHRVTQPGSEIKSDSSARPSQPDAPQATSPVPERGRTSEMREVRPSAPLTRTVQEIRERRGIASLEPQPQAGQPQRESGSPRRAPLEPPPPVLRQAPSPSREAPRLEIGHLHVEVVPAPTEPPPSRQKKRPARPAASSQPQRSRPRSKLRFGLGGL